MSQLGKVCNACGRERSKTKALVYDPETLMPYCEFPHICNTNHPNSVPNLLKRGAELVMINQTEAQRLFKEHLIKTIGNTDKIAKIRNMVDKPMTIRIGSPDLAIFLIELQEQYHFSSLSDTIRYCIQVMKENQGEYYSDYKKMEETREEVKQEKALVESIEDSKPLEEKPKEEVKEPEQEEVWDF
jgi:hypothetical protein